MHSGTEAVRRLRKDIDVFADALEILARRCNPGFKNWLGARRSEMAPWKTTRGFGGQRYGRSVPEQGRRFGCLVHSRPALPGKRAGRSATFSDATRRVRSDYHTAEKGTT